MNKKVLLFSSGMDSYIISKIEQPEVLLFIDNRSKYAQREKEFLKTQNYSNLIFVDDFINMSSIEREDAIIPSRNLYFCAIAANYGDNIIMGATAGDRSTDKDITFANQMSQVLSHIHEPSHWCPGREIKILLPYKNSTKQDLIRSYIQWKLSQVVLEDQDEKQITKEVIDELVNNSWSCYHPTADGEQCNTCKPDLRKFLAILGATGIDISDRYKISPRAYFTKEVIEQWIQKESGDNNRGRESQEIIETLKNL